MVSSCVLCLCDTSKCFEAVINLTSSLPTGFRESDSEASEMLTNTFVKEAQRTGIKTSCNVIFCVFVISFFLVFNPFFKSFSHCNWTNFVRLVFFLFVGWQQWVRDMSPLPISNCLPTKNRIALCRAHTAHQQQHSMWCTRVLHFTRVLL